MHAPTFHSFILGVRKKDVKMDYFSLKKGWNYVGKRKTVRDDFSRSVNSERVSIKIRRSFRVVGPPIFSSRREF